MILSLETEIKKKKEDLFVSFVDENMKNIEVLKYLYPAVVLKVEFDKKSYPGSTQYDPVGYLSLLAIFLSTFTDRV